jgi:hypothetical protein
MSLPIPELSKHSETSLASKTIKGPRPAGLGILIRAQTMLLMIEIPIFQLSIHCPSITESDNPANFSGFYWSFLVWSLVWLLLFYLLWTGSARARIVVILLSALTAVGIFLLLLVLALCGFLMPPDSFNSVNLSYIVHAAMALCWLQFLSSPAAIDFYPAHSLVF